MKNPFIDNKENSKIDSFLIHSMPFLPTWSRKKDFEIVRNWGKQFIKITAPETLNAYDLISLLQFLRDFIQNKKNYKENKIKIDEEEKIIYSCKLDLEQFCKERNLSNNKNNRATIYNSFVIIFNMKAEIGATKEFKNKNITRFIYEIKNKDEEYKRITLLVNKTFFDFCLKKGLMINLDKLINYQKNYYAVLLDAFLQSTNFEKYDEELLFEKIGFNETKLKYKTKKDTLKKTFNLINSEIKKYQYDKKLKKWIKKEISLSEFIVS